MEITRQPIALGILGDKMADLSAINIYCSNFPFLTFQAKKGSADIRHDTEQTKSCPANGGTEDKLDMVPAHTNTGAAYWQASTEILLCAEQLSGC